MIDIVQQLESTCQQTPTHHLTPMSSEVQIDTQPPQARLFGGGEHFTRSLEAKAQPEDSLTGRFQGFPGRDDVGAVAKASKTQSADYFAVTFETKGPAEDTFLYDVQHVRAVRTGALDDLKSDVRHREEGASRPAGDR